MTLPGRMRERVRFERRQTSSDGYGNTVDSWNAITTVAARIRPMSRGETVLASKLQGTRTTEIIVRSSSLTRGLTPDDRAVDTRSNDIWNIRAIENRDEHEEYLTIVCETGVAT